MGWDVLGWDGGRTGTASFKPPLSTWSWFNISQGTQLSRYWRDSGCESPEFQLSREQSEPGGAETSSSLLQWLSTNYRLRDGERGTRNACPEESSLPQSRQPDNLEVKWTNLELLNCRSPWRRKEWRLQILGKLATFPSILMQTQNRKQCREKSPTL